MTKYIRLGDIILQFKFLEIKNWSVTFRLCKSFPWCQIRGEKCIFYLHDWRAYSELVYASLKPYFLTSLDPCGL